MAQAGFSGEPRYALPGVALLAIAARGGRRGGRRARGALPAARASPPSRCVAAGRGGARGRASCATCATPRRTSGRWRATSPTRCAAAGGREAVLACGRPYVGRYRGPLMAYALDVTKRTVEPDAAPRAPGVVFRARLTAASAPAPDAGPPFRDRRARRRVGGAAQLLRRIRVP